MSYYTGRHGSLLLDGVKIGQVQNWSVSSTVTLLSVKTLAETDDRFIADSRTTSGSCRVLYEGKQAGNDNASAFINKVFKQRIPNGPINQGATLAQGDDPDENRSTLRLKVDDGTSEGRYIEMRIIITNVSLNMAVGELFAADIAFQAHGAPVFVVI
jgi:hypothetical protein